MRYLKKFKTFEDDSWIEPTGTEWHKSPGYIIAKCIVAIYRLLGTMHRWEKNTIIIDDVSVKLSGFDGHLILDFAVPEKDRNQGNMNSVLKKILKVVDEYGIYCEVYPTPHPTPHKAIRGEVPNKKQLVEIFKKFGFTNIVDGRMERTPEISEDKFNELLDKLHQDKNSLTKEDKDMMKRYSGDTTPYMDPAKANIEEEPERIYEFEVDPSYTHFALRMSNNKIVNGWDFSTLKGDSSIKEHARIDLRNMFPDDKVENFKILTTSILKRMRIDPFNWDNWETNKD